MVEVVFRLPDGSERRIGVAPGTTLLDASRQAGVEIEGACGGCMACATCHVYIADGWASHLEAPSAEEDGMLDLAPDWRPISRLGCQVRVDESLNGIVADVPNSSLLGD